MTNEIRNLIVARFTTNEEHEMDIFIQETDKGFVIVLGDWEDDETGWFWVATPDNAQKLWELGYELAW